MAYRFVRSSNSGLETTFPLNTTAIVSVNLKFQLTTVPINTANGSRYLVLGRFAPVNFGGYYTYMDSAGIKMGYYNGTYHENVGLWTPDLNPHTLGMIWDFSTTTAVQTSYLDGVLLSSTPTTRGTVASNSQRSLIGYSFNAPGVGSFNGDISEIGFWDIVLSESNFQSLTKYSPHLICPQSLTRYYPLINNLHELKSSVAITISNGSPSPNTHPLIYK